jgi:hypothetical protein
MRSTTTSAKRIARTVSLVASFSASSVTLAFPGDVARDRVAREARLRARNHAVLADERVDERGFSGIRAADDGDPQRPLFFLFLRLFFLIVLAALLDLRLEAEGGEGITFEVSEAHAMLRRDGDRLAEAQLEGFVKSLVGGAALALVGDENDGTAG